MPQPVSTAQLGRAFTDDLSRFPDLRWKLQGLVGGAAPYALWSLLEPLDCAVLIVTADSAQAEELTAALRAMAGELDSTAFLQRRVHGFPAAETPPLEMVSPAAEVSAARMAALYRLHNGQPAVVVATAEALVAAAPPPGPLTDQVLHFAVGQSLDLDETTSRLQREGYRRREGCVDEPGELVVRGGILDIWPAGLDYPCRIELLGDTVESLRSFDPADQRSFETCREVLILPALPFALEELSRPDVRRLVESRCDDLLVPTTERRLLDDCLAAGRHFPGAELLAAYVDGRHGWIADYLPANVVTVVVDRPAVEDALVRVYAAVEEAAGRARGAGTFHPDPADLYVDRERVAGLLGATPTVEVDRSEALESGGSDGQRTWRLRTRANGSITAAAAQVRARRGESGFAPIASAIQDLRRAGSRVVILASDPGRLARLEHLLELGDVTGVSRAANLRYALQGEERDTVWLVHAHLRHGFDLPADHLTVVTDEEIFGERRAGRRRRVARKAQAYGALGELTAGDFVVHVDHGIGLYRGLRHMVAAGTEGDFLHMEYAGGDRYYLPVDRINLVEKYSGGSSSPTLDKLGGTAWVRTKKRARDSILEMARELLDLEAYRAVQTRPYAVRHGGDFEEFEARFPFEETQGQLDAVEAVIGDFTGDKPMDRVVCGDVGYGKTEVAARAAYLVAMAGRQVAFLVPTTVLARQHYRTLQERFQGYPLQIRMLSRFQSAAENAEIVAGLAAGSVDIIVGTHRLLQADVDFARLGLLIIDEEHRFGVRAKERIKRVRREIDVMTLTATPIPRTLQLALSGVRDLSLIETPPVDRLAIRTYVARYDETLVQQVIERELERKGQAFFVHNRVASIDAVARRLSGLLPTARLGVAHGQQNEAHLEEVMMAFLDHRTDVLVCTSIIESGLDIPNANTIVVNRADTFGLAQLYQIRGRVGRSHRRAYAYLMVPGERLITEQARKRLDVLQQLDDLGAGFRLAAHDMEIRGAGNLLGKQQSGHVAAVGFEMFLRMMEETTRELRGQDAGPRVEPEIELGGQSFLPENYVEDVGERLRLYKRMAAAASAEDVRNMAEEIEDRFGALPPQAQSFVRVMRLRPALLRLSVESLKANANVVAFKLAEGSVLDPQVLLSLARSAPRLYRVRPGNVFTMKTTASDWNERVDEIEALLTAWLGTVGEGDVDAVKV